MIDVNIGTAFLAGILTFFAPCTFPLLPAFIGASAASHEGERRGIFLRAVGFVCGFIVVFVALGLLAGGLGQFFLLHREALMRVGGLVIVAFALLLLGIVRVPALSARIAPRVPLALHRSSPVSSFILGFAFALGWTPCLGPILGSILVLATTSGKLFAGATLLLAYGIGVGLPFILASLLYAESVFRSTRVLAWGERISRIGGVILLLLGLAMLLGLWGDFVAAVAMRLPTTGATWLIDHM